MSRVVNIDGSLSDVQSSLDFYMQITSIGSISSIEELRRKFFRDFALERAERDLAMQEWSKSLLEGMSSGDEITADTLFREDPAEGTLGSESEIESEVDSEVENEIKSEIKSECETVSSGIDLDSFDEEADSKGSDKAIEEKLRGKGAITKLNTDTEELDRNFLDWLDSVSDDSNSSNKSESQSSKDEIEKDRQAFIERRNKRLEEQRKRREERDKRLREAREARETKEAARTEVSKESGKEKESVVNDGVAVLRPDTTIEELERQGFECVEHGIDLESWESEEEAVEGTSDKSDSSDGVEELVGVVWDEEEDEPDGNSWVEVEDEDEVDEGEEELGEEPVESAGNAWERFFETEDGEEAEDKSEDENDSDSWFESISSSFSEKEKAAEPPSKELPKSKEPEKDLGKADDSDDGFDWLFESSKDSDFLDKGFTGTTKEVEKPRNSSMFIDLNSVEKGSDKPLVGKSGDAEPKKDTEVPKDLRDFIRQHNNVTIEFAMQYYSKKEIERNIALGRVYKRKGKLMI